MAFKILHIPTGLYVEGFWELGRKQTLVYLGEKAFEFDKYTLEHYFTICYIIRKTKSEHPDLRNKNIHDIVYKSEFIVMTAI